MITQEQLDKVYLERNHLAIALAHLALGMGLKAGRGIDHDAPEGWDPEWCRVVYVELPDGQQVSWHMGPGAEEAWAQLPEYAGTWDGTSLGRQAAWPTRVRWHVTPDDLYQLAANRLYQQAVERLLTVEKRGGGRVVGTPPELGMGYGDKADG